MTVLQKDRWNHNLHMLLKQKSPSLPRNMAPETFGDVLIVSLTKVNLLYLIYSTDWRCCLLHLIKQSYLPKTFLRTLILMTLVALYLFSLLELIWNCITPKMVKKVITNLDYLRHLVLLVFQWCSNELWAWTFIHTSWIF